jgi:hypothetical protein
MKKTAAGNGHDLSVAARMRQSRQWRAVKTPYTAAGGAGKPGRLSGSKRSSYRSKVTRTESRILDDRILADQAIAESLNGRQQSRPFLRAPGHIDAQKDDARHLLRLTKHKVSEILVFGQQQPLLMTSVSGARGSTSHM